MRQVSVKQLHDDNREALALAWVAAQDSAAVVRREAAASAALIGHLNLTHPNTIQVLGAYETSLAAGYDPEHHARFAARLFAAAPAAIILADGVAPLPGLMAGAVNAGIPLFSTPRSAAAVIEKLSRYLGKALADTTERHGVFMDVLGVGVLITGESGVGKSELGLELISRGHGLVADDVTEIRRIAANTLEGRCPPLLRDFIEVRGLGLLNVRTIFGQTAVRPKMKLKLVVQLERPAAGGVRDAAERLPLSELSEEILGVTVRKVIVPVAAGRNLAVLLEAAVRNYILQLRGINSMAEFVARQKQAMEHEPLADDD
ncbi:MAG: HPr kinase/phosphorylase [Betaproteobacteria bacterium RIFCSPLOWO2_02_FULL_67_19]|nr:MAG: HPr kinase/phosphorylase [Betaproteobacteria bacterium RIFCSPLOWO2_02_FULL_67_19]